MKKLAAFLAFFLLAGCAARRIERDGIPEGEKFWSGCQETAPANPDGFQHFVCTDVKSKQWEVLIRLEPTK